LSGANVGRVRARGSWARAWASPSLAAARRGASAEREVAAAARLVGLRPTDVLGGRAPGISDVVTHAALVKRGVPAADGAHRRQLDDVFGERHEGGERRERAAVEGHAQPGDHHRGPGAGEVAHQWDEVGAEELRLVDGEQVEAAP